MAFISVMPWWGTIYLVVIFLVTVFGIYLEIRDREKPIIIVMDGLAELVFVYFAVCFWISTLNQLPKKITLVIYLTAIVWEVAGILREIRAIRLDPELSITEQRWVLIIAYSLFIPAYVLAGMTAFR